MMEKNNTSLRESMKISPEERKVRLQYVNFTDEDGQLLKKVKPLMEKKADFIVDQFYNNIQHYPELMNLIDKAGSNINRLKQSQKQYLLELFDGCYDEAYFNRRLRIGIVHKQIGLTPRWYLGGYSQYINIISPFLLRKYWFSPGTFLKTQQALNKILSVDSQLAIDTYIAGLIDDINQVSLSKEEIESKVALYKQIIAKVAKGDLTEQIEVSGEDDLASLGTYINSMINSLSEMTEQIFSASDAMIFMLDQLNGNVSAQSSGASQQASAVNETTTTLEEIKATTQQTQMKAQTLGEAADKIGHEGEQGIEAVAQVIDAMNDIRDRVNSIAQTIMTLSDKTQQIGNIINVVSNLAQNSKMLALNASIEAAKAGEAGKGFAIVASEVRDLAEQSQQSTEQIQRILSDIQQASERAVMATEQGTKGVDRGEYLVKQTGETMEHLNSVIHDAVIASQQIVAAIRQEGAGISQVAVAMNQINSVTAQFVDATNQTKTVAGELSKVSEQLKASISVYKA